MKPGSAEGPFHYDPENTVLKITQSWSRLTIWVREWTRPKCMYRYRREGTFLSSLIGPNFALESWGSRNENVTQSSHKQY